MPLKFFHVNKFVVIVGILLLGFLVRFIIGYYSEDVVAHAEIEALNYAEKIMMDSINKDVIGNLEDSNMFIAEYKDNKLTRMYLDTYKLNYIRNQVSIYTDYSIKEINENDSIDTVAIPLGYFFGLKTLFDLELNIPISMEVIGNQRVDISYKNVSSGINTTIVEFFIEIAIDLRLTLPLKVINTCSVTKIPLAYEIINNDVPYFFSSST